MSTLRHTCVDGVIPLCEGSSVWVLIPRTQADWVDPVTVVINVMER